MNSRPQCKKERNHEKIWDVHKYSGHSNIRLTAAGFAVLCFVEQSSSKSKRLSGAAPEDFDELDFDVYSNQKWDRLQESHADDILVTYPDSHQSKGLKAHIDELKPLFVFAPDTKITTHPIKFGSDDWTCVTGVMTGTFTKPMPAGDGKTIPPTGKSFKINMATVGHWKNGKMIEESLFWDNQEFMKQIGLGK